MSPGAPASLQDLPLELLCSIFRLIPLQDKQRAVQLVCTRWRDLLCMSGSPGPWGSVRINLYDFIVENTEDDGWRSWEDPPSVNTDKVLGCLSWISKRVGGVEKLEIRADLAEYVTEDEGGSTDYGGVRANLFKNFFTCLLGFLATGRCPNLHLDLVVLGGGVGGIRRSPLCDPALAPALSAHLHHLHLGYVDVSETELNSIAGLHSLRSLFIGGGRHFETSTSAFDADETDLVELPDAFSKLVELQTLTIRGPPHITDLPEGMGCLRQLRVLHLCDSALIEVPASFTDLASLTRFACGNGQLGAFPAELCVLTDLRHIDLSGNGISQLPTAVSSLVLLSELNLGYNAFEVFPDAALIGLTELVSLSIDGMDASLGSHMCIRQPNRCFLGMKQLRSAVLYVDDDSRVHIQAAQEQLALQREQGLRHHLPTFGWGFGA